MTASEVFERVASVGLAPNMILYLTREYGLETAKAANLIFAWSGANHLTPFIGAIIADSYVGKYRMIVFGSILSFLVILFNFVVRFRSRPVDKVVTPHFVIVGRPDFKMSL